MDAAIDTQPDAVTRAATIIFGVLFGLFVGLPSLAVLGIAIVAVLQGQEGGRVLGAVFGGLVVFPLNAFVWSAAVLALKGHRGGVVMGLILLLLAAPIALISAPAAYFAYATAAGFALTGLLVSALIALWR